MTATRHRRHATELKIRLAEAYLNGEGSLKAIAKARDISHNLLMIWVDKYRREELTEEVDFIEKQRSYQAHVAALERKIGPLTMEIDALKKRQRTTSPAANGRGSAGRRFRPRCQAMGVRPPTGTAGDAYDTAMAERFVACLECEQRTISGSTERSTAISRSASRFVCSTLKRRSRARTSCFPRRGLRAVKKTWCIHGLGNGAESQPVMSAATPSAASCTRGKSQMRIHQAFERSSDSSVPAITNAPAVSATTLSICDWKASES